MIVYLITNTVNGKQYVGKTVFTLTQRWREHCHNAEKRIGRSRLYVAIRKYGSSPFIQEVLATTKSEERLNQLETFWIAKLDTFNNGYNLTQGGEGATGYRHSASYKHALSKRNQGKLMSGAARSALLASHSGKPVSEETRKRMREGAKSSKAQAHHRELVKLWTGRKHSPETLLKMSEAARQRWARERAA